MTLRLRDKWVWDFWLAADDDLFHMFYLQTPKSIGDPNLRHWNVSIGHALSSDLVTWEPTVNALGPGSDGAWDSKATWTGSVVRDGTRWLMFYTGSSTDEDGRVQRIGLATSEDLTSWTKHPANPLIEVDPTWYERYDPDLRHDEAWRDPWVHVEPDGSIYCYITSRVNHGRPDGRGVVGLARSDNFVDWRVAPPVSEPGDFGQLEVPQLLKTGGRYYLLFSVDAGRHSEARRRRLDPVTGTHYLVADLPAGPFRPSTDDFLAGDDVGTYYAGKIVEADGRGLFFLAAHHNGRDHRFLGEIADPVPVRLTPDNRLVLASPNLLESQPTRQR